MIDSPEPPSDSSSRDRLFAGEADEFAGFRFDEAVASVFADMIERSVPGYATVIGMTGVLAARHARPGSCVYDLGCSLGAGTLSMARALHGSDCRIVAVDSSVAMIRRLRQRLADDPPPVAVEVVEADITAMELVDASVVALNYTLQFVPRRRRAALLERIRGAMAPGDCLILSEKIRFADPEIDELFVTLHHEFKGRRGYSELEISRKRAALENVLVPETLEAHRARLDEAGFARIAVWFQCFNFASLVAFA